MPDPVLTHVWTDSTTGSGTSHTFNNGGSAWTPTAGDGYVLIVVSAGASGNPTADAATMVASTTGLTMALVGSSQFGTSPVQNVAVYSAQPAGTPAAGSIVGTWAVSQGGVVAVLLRVDNPGDWGALADGLIQAITFVDSDPNPVANLTVTQSAAAQANSVMVAAFATNIEGQVDPSDASFTELVDVAIAGGRNRTLEVMWRANDDDLAANGISKNAAGTATSAKMLGVIFEVVNESPPLTAVGKSLQAVWDVRAAVTRSRQIVWDVDELGVTPSPTVTFVFSDSDTGSNPFADIDNAGVDVLPVTGAGYLLVLASAGATGITSELPTSVDASSMGLDFVLVGFVEYSTNPVIILSVWAALPPTSPTTGQIEVDWAANQGGWMATVLKIADPADYGPFGEGMIHSITFADSDPNAVAGLTVTQPLAARTGSVMVAAFGSNINGSLTPSDASFTELSDLTIATGRNRTLETMWRNASDDVSAAVVSYNASAVATSARIAGVLLEVLRADPPVTAVGRSLVALWDVDVEDPPAQTTVVVTMRGAVTAAEIGLEPDVPESDAPEFRILLGGEWRLVAGALAPDA